MDLQRFIEAQSRPGNGYADALRELRSGGKRGHWIWYVFPQLEGLGRSAEARFYAISGLAEAVDYLQDPVLGPRLAEVSGAVAERLRAGDGLASLMDSTIDVLKLVSSMTLFDAAARRARNRQAPETAAQVQAAAICILDAAKEQGFPPCEFTMRLDERG